MQGNTKKIATVYRKYYCTCTSSRKLAATMMAQSRNLTVSPLTDYPVPVDVAGYPARLERDSKRGRARV